MKNYTDPQIPIHYNKAPAEAGVWGWVRFTYAAKGGG